MHMHCSRSPWEAVSCYWLHRACVESGIQRSVAVEVKCIQTDKGRSDFLDAVR